MQKIQPAGIRFQVAPYDKENATYIQLINFVNGIQLPGYSKKVGFAEPVDPINCLTNFILRMWETEYLRPSARIDPVKSIEYRLNHAPYTSIVSCTYEYPMISPEYLADRRFVDWLNAFYEDVNKKKPLSYMLKKYKRKGRLTEVDDLDVSQYGFTRPDHLLRHVFKLIEEKKHPLEHIQHFYRQCATIYFKQTDMKPYDSSLNKVVNQVLRNQINR